MENRLYRHSSGNRCSFLEEDWEFRGYPKLKLHHFLYSCQKFRHRREMDNPLYSKEVKVTLLCKAAQVRPQLKTWVQFEEPHFKKGDGYCIDFRR